MEDGAPSEHTSRSRDFLILASLWLLVFASSSQVMIVTPILPRIGEALNAPESLYGSLVAGFSIALGIMALAIGPISDRVGRRIILLLGTGTLTIVLGLHALAVNFTALLALRILAGAGAGMLSGAAVSYIGDYFPYNKRGAASGWVMSGFAVGQIIGIPLGTLLADSHGFRAPFLAFAAPMALSFVLILLCVPEPRSAEALAAERRRPFGLVPAARAYAELLRRPHVIPAALTFFLIFGAMTTLFVYLPTWLEADLAADAGDIATLFLIGGFASVVSGPLMGRVSDGLGRKPMIITSCLGFVALALAIPVLVQSLVVAYVVYGVAMVLYTMRLSPLQALMTALVDARQRGTLMCLTISVGQLGSAAGSGAVGPLYAEYGYDSNTALAAAFVALAALVVWRLLPEPARPNA